MSCKKNYKTCVIVYTYNGEKYIREQLDSIINQTIKPDQIVISDDCSTDNTVDIVNEILGAAGISYYINVNRKNMGITKNGTIGIQFCQGDLLFISDQDNVWNRKFIESFLEKFSLDSNLQYVYCNGYVTDTDLNIIKHEYDDSFFKKSKRQFLLDAINKRGFPHGHTVVLKLDFVKQIVPFMFAGDEWFAICAGALGNIGYINEKLIYYRRHELSFSKSEGGGKKESLLKKIRENSFEEYFVWPDCQYDAYKRYLELFEDVLDKDIYTLVEKHMFFEGELFSLKRMHLFSALKKLYGLYKHEEYRMYRGNRNTFFADCMFLILHREKR